MKKCTLLLLVLAGLFVVNEVSAQKYDAAVGARAGYYLTGTYKKFITESNAFEVYAGFSGYGGLVVGGLFQIHKPLEQAGIDNLDWYYGGGAYAGTYGWWSGSSFVAGVNLNIGLDYKFDEFPINVSLDWAPGINVVGGFYPSWVAGGLAVRYILGD